MADLYGLSPEQRREMVKAAHDAARALSGLVADLIDADPTGADTPSLRQAEKGAREATVHLGSAVGA